MEPIARLGHIAISVPDIDEVLAWYHDVFGFERLTEKVLEHIDTRVMYIGNGDFVMELIQFPGSQPTPAQRRHPDTDNAVQGLKHFCVLVDDSEGFVANLKRKGVPVVIEPKTSATYVAFINDPVGNVIEVYDSTHDVSVSAW